MRLPFAHRREPWPVRSTRTSRDRAVDVGAQVEPGEERLGSSASTSSVAAGLPTTQVLCLLSLCSCLLQEYTPTWGCQVLVKNLVRVIKTKVQLL
jgi:hypothetical protein